MRDVLRRRGGRIGLGIAAAIVLAAVVAAGVAVVYVFGGSGPTTHAEVKSATVTPNKDETAFSLVPSSSVATFTAHEVLFGQPKDVVGKTNAVSGQILVNAHDPSQSRVSQINIDLSTLVTDSSQRNNTLQNRILETSNPANQYATFTATAIKGIPASVVVGQTVHFQLVGNLTVHQVTKSETFAVTLTAQSATELTGTAQVTVRYEDFNLTIPAVPFVSDVSDNVTLALSFTATSAAHS